MGSSSTVTKNGQIPIAVYLGTLTYRSLVRKPLSLFLYGDDLQDQLKTKHLSHSLRNLKTDF